MCGFGAWLCPYPEAFGKNISSSGHLPRRLLTYALSLRIQQTRAQPLYGKFDGADSLLNKLDGASLSSPPPPPAPVAAVVEKVTYDTATSIEPAAKVAEKVTEAAVAPAAPVTSSSVSMPAVDMPSIDLPSVGGLDLPLPVIGGIAVAVLVAVALGASGGGNEGASTTSASSVASSSGSSDVSVPYDAPAILAWEEAGKPGDFATFKPKYISDTVAMVKSKQKK